MSRRRKRRERALAEAVARSPELRAAFASGVGGGAAGAVVAGVLAVHLGLVLLSGSSLTGGWFTGGLAVVLGPLLVAVLLLRLNRGRVRWAAACAGLLLCAGALAALGTGPLARSLWGESFEARVVEQTARHRNGDRVYRLERADGSAVAGRLNAGAEVLEPGRSLVVAADRHGLTDPVRGPEAPWTGPVLGGAALAGYAAAGWCGFTAARKENAAAR